MSRSVLVAVFLLLVVTASAGVDFYWRDYNGTIPSDALPTGHRLYIAQIIVERCGNAPGTFYPTLGAAVTSAWGYKVTAYSNFKILCTKEPQRYMWERVNAKDLNEGFLRRCLKAGYEYNSNLYIGKVYHEDVWKISKVFPITSVFNGLKAWWNINNRTYTAEKFDILVFE